MMKFGAAAAWVLLIAIAFYLGRLGTTSEIETAPPTGAELQAVLERANPLDRATGLSRYLQELSPANVEEAVLIIELNQRFFTQPEHLMLMTAWARFDPEAAWRWATTRDRRLQRRATIAAVEAIASTDPEAARALIADRDDLVFVRLLHEALLRGWARSDHIDSLTEYISEIALSDRQQTAISILTTELMKHGRGAVTGWAESVPVDAPGGFKKLAFHGAVTILALQDPADAAAWIQDSLEHDYAQGALESVARRWAARSWESAMDWLIATPRSDEREKTLKSLFGSSLKRRPDRAESWVRASAPNEAVDPAIRVIVQRDYWERASAAMEWSSLLHDDDIRREVQLGIGRSWYSREPDAFQAWLPESGLEQSVQDQIFASF